MAENGKVDLSVAVFSSEEYIKTALAPLTEAFTNVHFYEARLTKDSAKLAAGYAAVCLFVNDDCDSEVLEALAAVGVRFVAMRCAGYDRVDVEAARRLGIRVVRVPTYSPRSVAEHALALLFDVARNLNRAHLKVLVGNYTGSGLVGPQLSGKTFGIVGTGNIGVEFIKLLKGFEGRILAYDVRESPEALAAGAQYVGLEELLRESDFVSLHVPLLPATFHLINKERLHMMKPNAILVNVSRGGLIDTTALIEAVEAGQLGGCAMDVFEREGNLFFHDFTKYAPQDRMQTWDRQFNTLVSLPHVICTPHIAFLTHEALANIAATTVDNLRACALGLPLEDGVEIS